MSSRAKSTPRSAGPVPSTKTTQVKRALPADSAAVPDATGSSAVPPARRWSVLDLSPGVCAAIDAFGFVGMTPVQAATIPAFLSFKDVCVQAVTGSGKTLAFLVPVFEILIRRGRPLARHDLGALVLSPTRELAVQIRSVADVLCSHVVAAAKAVAKREGADAPDACAATLTVRTCIGGTDSVAEALALAAEGANVLIGTPGRVEQVLTAGASVPGAGARVALNTKALEVLVLDEADRLLEHGFQAALGSIIARLPKQRRTGLFSATLTDEVEELAKAGLRNPVKLTVRVAYKQDVGSASVARARQEALAAAAERPESAEAAAPVAVGTGGATHQSIPSSLSNYYSIVPVEEKFLRLAAFLREHKDDKVIVFCLTCSYVEYVIRALAAVPELSSTFSLATGRRTDPIPDPSKPILAGLHGKLPQNRRTAVYEAFRAAPRGALLCTDVAARGLDVPDISWVLQVDPPQQPDFYTHRIGRAARAGRAGAAVVFLAPHEKTFVDHLAARAIPTMELPPPKITAAEAESLLMPVKESYFFLRGGEGAAKKVEAEKVVGDDGKKVRMTVCDDISLAVKAKAKAAGVAPSAVTPVPYPFPALPPVPAAILKSENGHIYNHAGPAVGSSAHEAAEHAAGAGAAGVRLSAADAKKLATMRRQMKISPKEAQRIRAKEMAAAAAKAGIAKAAEEATTTDDKASSTRLPPGIVVEIPNTVTATGSVPAEAATSVVSAARALAATDRAFMLLGAGAFTAYVRAYKEHKLQFTLSLASVPFVRLALGMGLLYLPLLPDLKRYGLQYPKLTRVPAGAVPYADEEREAKREEEEAAKKAKNAAEKEARLKKDEEKEKDRARKEEIRKKKNKTKAKRTYEEYEDEWNELAAEAKKIKRKTKMGKKGQWSDSDDDDDDSDNDTARNKKKRLDDDDKKIRGVVADANAAEEAAELRASRGKGKGRKSMTDDSDDFDELDALAGDLRASGNVSKGHVKPQKRRVRRDDSDDDEEEEEEDSDDAGEDVVRMRGFRGDEDEDEDEDEDGEFEGDEGDEGDDAVNLAGLTGLLSPDVKKMLMQALMARFAQAGLTMGGEGDEGDWEGDEGDEDDADEDEDEEGVLSGADEEEEEDNTPRGKHDSDKEVCLPAPRAPASDPTPAPAPAPAPEPASQSKPLTGLLRAPGSKKSDAPPAKKRRVSFAEGEAFKQVRFIPPNPPKPRRGVALIGDQPFGNAGGNAAAMQQAMQRSLAQLKLSQAQQIEARRQQHQQQQMAKQQSFSSRPQGQFQHQHHQHQRPHHQQHHQQHHQHQRGTPAVSLAQALARARGDSAGSSQGPKHGQGQGGNRRGHKKW